MDSDDYSDSERRYRSQPLARSSAKNSILKNSSSSYNRKNALNSDDEDNQVSSRLSKNRYDSPLNSYRSEDISGKPPSGRLQPLPSLSRGGVGGGGISGGLDKPKSLISDYKRLTINDYDEPMSSRSRNLPAISYTSSSGHKANGISSVNNNNNNDSDDSISENFGKFSKKQQQSTTTSAFDKRYDNSKFESRYDTYDEDDTMMKKDSNLNSKYYRSDGPLTKSSYGAAASSSKMDPLDDLYRSSSARETRNVRSNSLDRLNSASAYNSLSNTNGSGGVGATKFSKFSSTSNINGYERSPDRSNTANSLNSTSMSIREAKARSFLVGSLSALNGKGLLSADELDRNLVDRKARILVATWNMGGVKTLPNNLDDLLLPESIQTMPDIYIIGVQEIEINTKDWEIKLQEQIGPSHVKLSNHYHGSIGVTIFIKRELIWYCSIVEYEHINLRGTGPINSPVKTKASVIISFQLFGTLMAFICSHFSAGEGNLTQRIENYRVTATGITLPNRLLNKTKATSADRTENFDCVFWFGDLNFLSTKDRDHVERKVMDVRYRNSLNFEEIMNHDELYQAINQEKAFKNFLEGRITFEPTYKYDINSDKYDTSEKCRIPSYTDRILYRCRNKGTISCAVYDAIKEIKLSDHRPVFGLFEVIVRPGVDKTPLSYGEFDRQVYAAGYQKRQMYRAYNVGFANSNAKKSICIIQ